MVFLRAFWEWLTRGPRTFGTDRDGFPILNVDQIAQELHLLAEAKRLGEAGLPAADAITLSGPEAAIVQRIELACKEYRDRAVRRGNILSESIARLSETQAINRAAQADAEFERIANSLFTDSESDLRTLSEDANNHKAELMEFKTTHKINRDARYPTNTGTYFRYAMLLVLVIVEAALNTGFFSQGLDTGYIGGFSSAAILAAVNVLLAFAFGKLLIRYINHSTVAKMIFGYLALALSLLIVFSMGLGIAHYRDSLNAELTNPTESAIHSIVASPFALRDIFSWGLLAISVAFGMFSLIDGLYTDDFYPGYGSISRRTKAAEDDYKEQLNALRCALEELRNQALHELDTTVSNSQAWIAEFSRLIADKNTTRSQLENALRVAQYSLDALLRKFRTENELYRQQIPRPEYFNQKIVLQDIAIPALDTTADIIALEDGRTQVCNLLANVQAIRARIQAAFNKQFDRLQPIALHFAEGART
jgi:hypothetical protein